MNEYKKKVDGIHAPEALINATLNKIHEEEKMQEMTGELIKTEAGKPEKNIIRPRKWAAGFTAVAAAAAMVFVIGLSNRNSAQINLIYNTVPETLVRSVDNEQSENSMSAEAYGEYLGLDIQKPTENATLVKAEIWVLQEGDIITEDESTIIYNVDGEQMMIQYSKTKDIVPENLLTGEMSEVNGQPVKLAVSANGKEYMAVFEVGEVTCFMMSYSMEKQEFEAFLSEFVNRLKK